MSTPPTLLVEYGTPLLLLESGKEADVRGADAINTEDETGSSLVQSPASQPTDDVADET